MSQDDQRKAFEAWIGAEYGLVTSVRFTDGPDQGEYKAFDIQLAWEAWQEATKQAIGEQMP